MTVRALIFDVDGTLAETEELHRRAFNETFADAGLGWHWSQADYSDLLKTTGGKERMRVFRDQIGATDPDDAGIAALHRDKTTRYAQLMQDGNIVLRSGIRSLAADARSKGVRLAVATTTSRPNIEALTHACWGKGADDVFDVIAAGDEVAAKKPAPDVYDLALDRLGLPAEDAIAIEDTRNGLLSARGAGLRVVITPSLYSAKEDFAGATVVVPEVSTLDDLMSSVMA